MSLSKNLVVAAFLLLPALAQAQLDCIVPTREEGFDPRNPVHAELQRAARSVVAIVQKNATFMQGNKPVRVRSSISYFGWDRQAVSVITTAYNQTAWLAGGCKVSKNADRGRSLADGTIAVFINQPESLLGGALGDSELKASGMPTLLATTAGFPVYAAGGNEDNPTMLITRAGYTPWMTVTLAEMLDWRERDLKQKEREYQAAVQASGDVLDEAKIEEMYRNMKTVNAVEAEKTRMQMLASLEKMRADSARQSALAAQWIRQQRSAFNAYRSSFTPAQLAGPGTISSAVTHDNVIRVDDPVGQQLARVDPAYARRDPGHIHMIVVGLALQPEADPEFAWHRASLAALDYAALAKLLSN